MDNPTSSTIDIHAYIVPYCERLTTGGEIVNVVSNIAFIVAVAACLPIAYSVLSNQRCKTLSYKVRYALLATLCLPALIAAGSAAFHATPSQLTHMLDIVPVAIFALCAALLFMFLAGMTTVMIMITTLCWIAATTLAAQRPDVLAHSLFYLPTAILLFLLPWLTRSGTTTDRPPQSEYVLITSVAVAFALALVFRALDLQLCQLGVSEVELRHQYGTHWLWHLFTATACALCLQLVFRMALRKYRQTVVKQ